MVNVVNFWSEANPFVSSLFIKLRKNMQMKTGCLTLQYHIMSVYACVIEGEEAINLNGGTWDSFVFKMQEHSCNKK